MTTTRFRTVWLWCCLGIGLGLTVTLGIADECTRQVVVCETKWAGTLNDGDISMTWGTTKEQIVNDHPEYDWEVIRSGWVKNRVRGFGWALWAVWLPAMIGVVLAVWGWLTFVANDRKRIAWMRAATVLCEELGLRSSDAVMGKRRPATRMYFPAAGGSGRWVPETIGTTSTLDDLRTRLARLECPKHEYESDTCVHCGAPKPEEADDAR